MPIYMSQGNIKESKMGLACSQIRLLTLTSRKADCEYGISVDSMRKMALTREMSELSSEYYSRLQSKNVAYFANGQYHDMDYTYLMGSTRSMDLTQNPSRYKSDPSMVLTDYRGQVVLSDEYANVLQKALGLSTDTSGRGRTFAATTDNMAKILAGILNNSMMNESQIKKYLDGKELDAVNFSTTSKNTMTQEELGKKVTDATASVAEKIEYYANFYLPIFYAAAANGWTTEYNADMNANSKYVSDALVTGTFQLATVEPDGCYRENESLTYFINSGLVCEQNDSSTREEVTAWYNAEKARISEKESWIDMDMQDLSTELEAINTEIQSIQSLIDDAISSVFDWGSQ